MQDLAAFPVSTRDNLSLPASDTADPCRNSKSKKLCSWASYWLPMAAVLRLSTSAETRCFWSFIYPPSLHTLMPGNSVFSEHNHLGQGKLAMRVEETGHFPFDDA
jgi:hypothetical protein